MIRFREIGTMKFSLMMLPFLAFLSLPMAFAMPVTPESTADSTLISDKPIIPGPSTSRLRIRANPSLEYQHYLVDPVTSPAGRAVKAPLQHRPPTR